MAFYAPKEPTISSGAVSFTNHGVWTVGSTIDGVVPIALGTGEFLDETRTDDNFRSASPFHIRPIPESGVADDLDTLNATPAPEEGQIATVWARTGETISVVHTVGGTPNTGKFKIANQTGPNPYNKIDIEGPFSSATFAFMGGFWCETSRQYIAP